MMNPPPDRQRWEKMRQKYPNLAGDMLSIVCEMDANNERIQRLLRDLDGALLAIQGQMLHRDDESRPTRKRRQRQKRKS